MFASLMSGNFEARPPRTPAYPASTRWGQATRFRLRSTLIETASPALLFQVDEDGLAGAFFASVRQAANFDPRLTLTCARLGNDPEPRLFMRFTHPDGAARLRAFARVFSDAFPQRSSGSDVPTRPAFELSAVIAPEPAHLLRMSDWIEQSPFRVTELACDRSFRFGLRSEPETLCAEEMIGFHFRLAFAGADPEEAFFSLIARAHPAWQLTCWRCGSLAPTDLLRPAMAGMGF